MNISLKNDLPIKVYCGYSYHLAFSKLKQAGMCDHRSHRKFR